MAVAPLDLNALAKDGLGLLKGASGLGALGGLAPKSSAAGGYADASNGPIGIALDLSASPVYNKPMIDLSNPLTLAILAGAGLVGLVLWWKIKR